MLPLLDVCMEKRNIVDEVLADMFRSHVSDKMKALLHIAGKVQISGKSKAGRDCSSKSPGC